MRKLTTILITAAILLTGCRKGNDGNGSVGRQNASNAQVCADIHAGIDSGMLDARGTRVEIQLHADSPGVTDRIRAAVDTYYRGDHAAGRQAMLSACAVAGYPAK